MTPRPSRATHNCDLHPSGYTFTIDHLEYCGYNDAQGARPFTLIDCWHAVYGVGNARIYSPEGRLVLNHAGSLSRRWEHINRARNIRRRARGLPPMSGAPLTLTAGKVAA